MTHRPVLFALALAASVAAASGTAQAARPHAGPWEGTDGVSFTIDHTEHGGTYVENARLGARDRFGREPVDRDDTFETCTTQRIGEHLARHWCIEGRFTERDEVRGTIESFYTAHGSGRTRRTSENWTGRLAD